MNINFYLYIGLWNLKILREYIYNILIQFNFFIALGDEILQRIGILLKKWIIECSCKFTKTVEPLKVEIVKL